MTKRITILLGATMFALGLPALVMAQSCQEIHGLGSTGCAPSPFDGQPVNLTGVVYVIAGTYNDGSVYWQCDLGGLLFFDANALGVIEEGDLIEVSGTVGAFGDEIQINDAVWSVLDEDHYAIPLAIGTGALAAGTDQLGNFMRVEGVLSLVSAGFNSIYEVDDGTGPVTVFVDGTTGIDTSVIDQWLGDWVLVQGSTKCYDGAGEILPRRNEDVTLVSIPTEEMTWGAVKALY